MWDGNDSFSRRLHDFLCERLIGQEAAIQDIVRALVPRLFHNLFSERTIGAFLLVGPAGVGKGRLAECLAEFLLGDAEQLLRLNCSLFQQGSQSLGLPLPHLPALMGQPAAPSSSPIPGCRIVLLENIEQSSPALVDLWTHILSYGQVSLDDGPPLHFDRTLFLLKSAVGQQKVDNMVRNREVGFSRESAADATARENEVREVINRAIEITYPPRFLYHVTRVIHFRRLSADDLRLIMDRLVDEAATHFRGLGIVLRVDERVRQELRDLATDRGRWGAKGLRQVIIERLFYPLYDLMLSRRLHAPAEVWVEKGERDLIFAIPATSGAPPSVARPLAGADAPAWSLGRPE